MTMTPGLTFRLADPADTPWLASFGARAFEAAFGRDNTPDNMRSYLADQFSVETITAELQDPQTKYLIAWEWEDRIGYAKLQRGSTPPSVEGPESIELARLYVDPDRLSRGVGSRLMQGCIELARQLGCKTLWLGVWERNLRAIAFYERWGFRKIGKQSCVVGDDVQTDHVMVRLLLPEGDEPDS